jgi:hypothetical protein
MNCNESLCNVWPDRTIMATVAIRVVKDCVICG